MLLFLAFRLYSLIAFAHHPCDFNELPQKLSQTCLYKKDGAINKDLLLFKPKYTLWTDGADKMRWIYLPAGTQIDSSDMNHWKFPVGTKVFKQFALHGKKLETRLFIKIQKGNGIESWQMGPYIWNEEQSDATLTLKGAQNVLGTHHDVPNQRMCVGCHMGSADGNLGFSALQQSSILDLLVRKNWLTHAPRGSTEIVGNQIQSTALGYIHANCSHCHNPNGVAPVMNLYYDLGTKSVEESNAYQSTVNRSSRGSDFMRIEPGYPERSYVYQRISSRTPGIQMPPVGTKEIDSEGRNTIFNWIKSL